MLSCSIHSWCPSGSHHVSSLLGDEALPACIELLASQLPVTGALGEGVTASIQPGGSNPPTIGLAPVGWSYDLATRAVMAAGCLWFMQSIRQ